MAYRGSQEYFGSWSNQDMHTNSTDRLTVSLQRQLPNRIHLDATYSFDNIQQNYSKNLNMMDPQLSYTYKAVLAAAVANPFYNYLTPDKFPGTLRNQASVPLNNLLKIYPQYGALTQDNTPGGRDVFQMLQFKARRDFAKGYSFFFSYSYVRERNYAFWDDLAQYAERWSWFGATDPRHRVSISGTGDLPFGRGRKWLGHAHPVLDGVFGGWSTTPVFTMNSGTLLSFGSALVAPGNPKLDHQTLTRWFDTSLFQRFPAYTVRTNPVTYPGLVGPKKWNIDMSLAKRFRITERCRLEFRMEAYNMTNSIMWGMPNVSVQAANLGRITSQANVGRELQYTARLHF
jgi:hypothetical protein